MQTNQISYRIANTSDIEAIAIIHSNSWKRTYRGIYSDHYLDFEVDNDRMTVWKQRFETPEIQHIIVAEIENKVFGFICIFLNKEALFGSLIDNLHVKFEFQGKGIGKILLKKAAIYIKQKTATDAMFLWVLVKNIEALQFYLKLGAKNYETKSLLCPDGGFYDCYRMIWNENNSLV